MNNEREAFDEQSGLVISDITGEAGNEVFDEGFVSEGDLAQAIDGFTPLPGRTRKDILPRFSIELSPGTVRLTKKAPPKGQPRDGYKPRSIIVEWSRKSRAAMTLRLGTLDYRPLFLRGRLPAMITLTYPGDWLTVAPDAATAQRHLNALRKRYEYQFGEPLIGLWKREHQRSGSPHFHLFAAPPSGRSFAIWLSKAWADIVAHPDPNERAKHERAGTGIDYATGIRASDPRRVATYFSKHNSANFGVKEYQNRPPQQWIDAGSVGRFWGYWGIKPLVLTVEISDNDALFVARVLRRWSKANSQSRSRLVPRGAKSNGEMKFRRVSRRRGRFLNGLGFAIVGDGSAMGEALARALRSRISDER
jgi:hypothetical protein